MSTVAIEERAWNIARTLPAFGYAEISIELKIGLERATAIVRAWERVGALTPVKSGAKKRKLWRVADPDRSAPPQGRSAADNLWTAMRKLRVFSPTDLSAHATTEHVAVSTEEALAYCRSLLDAGYARVERKAVPGLREAIYRLTRDTGPLPPREKRVRAIIDDNVGDVKIIGGAA
jgi:hypothetical protein